MAAYVRVSTDAQGETGLGIAAQTTAVDHAVAGKGWTLAETVTEVISGASKKRPRFDHLLARLAAGEFDGLVVAKLDRLSRSAIQTGQIIEAADREGWVLYVCDMGMDTSTDAGWSAATIFAAIAAVERRAISSRTKAAMREAKARGTHVGRPRLERPALVARVRQDRADGVPWRGIAERLNAEGVPTARGGSRWYASTVVRLLETADSHEHEKVQA